MPLKLNETRESAPAPNQPHLGLLTGLQGGTWVAIPAGAWMLYATGAKDAQPTPMLLAFVKPGKYGIELEFACCNNPKCTKRLKMGGKWMGRHFEMGKDEDVRSE